MTASGNRPGRGKEVSESIDHRIIDAELAAQLDGLIESIEAVRWVDVPGLSATTAATFNRRLIEARSQLLMPRVITDGGREPVDIDDPDRTSPEGRGQLLIDQLSLDGRCQFTVLAGLPKDRPEELTLWVGIPWGQVEFILRPSEARRIAEELLAGAEECEQA